MENNYASDKPISVEIDDRFQRYNFSRRIAQTIINRSNEDSIVIGIYGAWGEGKTSVLNFIDKELETDPTIISIKFNPWRYNDENALLKQFFQKLATALNSKLKTKKEEAGEFLKKYSKLLDIDIPFVGNIAEKTEKIGDFLGEADVETLKERIGNILKESKNRIVIFIDDIDRLDKNEIHAIFRLVKLTGDFSNTVYILSFDEKVVSAAIGERFGEGDQKAGQNFLEKIIQVPLSIPLAQKDALKEFVFELTERALNENNIQITEDELRRFSKEFFKSLLLRVSTPRSAIRYNNSIAFSLPLLYREVNIVDLLLIEAVKSFYPKHYDFIKSNPEFFIGTYKWFAGQNNDQEKIDQIKRNLDDISVDLKRKEKVAIQGLLEELFPRLNEAFHNNIFTNNDEDDWYKNKRIVSPKYFNRYFSYAVIKGDISDVVFRDFLLKIFSQSVEDVRASMAKLINQSSADNFLIKLSAVYEFEDWEIAKKIISAICSEPSLFPKKEGNYFMGFESSYGQAASLISDLIRTRTKTDDMLSFISKLLAETKKFDFAYEVYYNLLVFDSNKETTFTEEELESFSFVLLDRIKDDSSELPFYKNFPSFGGFIFRTWLKQDKDGLTKSIKIILEKEPSEVIDLLKEFTPNVHSSNVKGSYKGDFTKDQYFYFTSVFDKEFINSTIDKIYNPQESDNEKPKWFKYENIQSDINLVRQFKYWFRIDSNGELEKADVQD